MALTEGFSLFGPEVLDHKNNRRDTRPDWGIAPRLCNRDKGLPAQTFTYDPGHSRPVYLHSAYLFILPQKLFAEQYLVCYPLKSASPFARQWQRLPK